MAGAQRRPPHGGEASGESWMIARPLPDQIGAREACRGMKAGSGKVCEQKESQLG